MPYIESFDRDWTFREGGLRDEEARAGDDAYNLAKTESGRGAARAADTAYGFAPVAVPHDFVIGGAPDKSENRSLGYLRHGVGCYRKKFALPADWANKRVAILFDGVMSRADVWVNGIHAASHSSGYAPFEVDITDFANFGGGNVITVVADSRATEGWWYQGGGIYRHVWLRAYEKVSAELWGVLVRAEKLPASAGTSAERWRVRVVTTVRNDDLIARTARVAASITGPDGAPAASGETSVEVGALGRAESELALIVEAPAIWDIDSPALYKCSVDVDGDVTETEFGFRETRFDADEGFFLNGRRVFMKGVCCHQDYGITGIAVPDEVYDYRARLWREMGANAYRTAHNLSAPEQMDACDRRGVLVMDETRWFSTSPDALADFRTMLLRDRNRPSVVLWSVGNEEPLQSDPKGARIAERLTAEAHRLDPTRPTTLAQNGGFYDRQAIEKVDVIGFNYFLKDYDAIHARYPDKPVIASECVACGTTRGFYFPDDAAAGYNSAYDHLTNDFGNTREATWRHVSERPWVAGMFVWAGIEHRGETVWPRLCSQSGSLDLFLRKKDAFWQNKAQWDDRPTLHLLPHWNHAGREGELIRVCAYTNAASVELYLNGESLGEKAVPDCGYPEWSVEYRPGELCAVGRDVSGEEVSRDCVRTTGPAVRLKLKLDHAEMPLHAGSVALAACTAVDADGNEVPDAACDVLVTAENGTVLGTGSDVCDHVPPNSARRRMSRGIVSAAVRAAGSEPVIIRAYAPGLISASLVI